ncbi:MAG: PD-(D/E)XK nuclease family protein [Gemmatimonadaceae bacterium]
MPTLPRGVGGGHHPWSIASRVSQHTSPASPRAPHPSFSWSFSRALLLERCERLYYEHYYGSHGGWMTDALAQSQLAFRLKQLTTPNAELGRAVHRRAAEIARAVRDSAPPPTEAVLLARTQAELEAVIMRHPTDPEWLLDPRRAPLLHEAFYAPMGLTRRRRLLNELIARAAVLQATLLASPIWRAAALPGAAILCIDEPILGALDGISTIATPDLVLRLPEDRVIVLDWKTGASGDLTQVVLYAHAVRAALGEDFAAGHCEAWLVHLDRGSIEALTVTAADVEIALKGLRASTTRMRALLNDPQSNIPKERATFRMATDPNVACRRCKMLALCSPEFAGAAAAA